MIEYPFSTAGLRKTIFVREHIKLVKILEDSSIDIIKHILYLPIREIRGLDNYFCTFGVYFFANKYYPLYIGSSRRVKKRIDYHPFIQRKSNNVSIFVTKNYDDAYLLENIMIEQIRPKYNYTVDHQIINKRYVMIA